jgi:zinc-ribbon domain
MRARKILHCDDCDQLVFFENTFGVTCGQFLAYLPDDSAMGTFEPKGDNLRRMGVSAGEEHNFLIVPNGMGHMDGACDSWHQSRIVPPRRKLRRVARGQALTRSSRLDTPGGTIPLRRGQGGKWRAPASGDVSPASRRREGALLDQLLPESNAVVEVYLENADGGPAVRC